MTPDLRDALKQAVDRHVRAQLGTGRCAGCGGHRDNRTDGCTSCRYRFNTRRRRERQRAAV